MLLHKNKACLFLPGVLGGDGGAVFGQEGVGQLGLLVADGGDDVLGLFGHLVQEQVDDAQRPLLDVAPLLRAKVVGDLRKVRADQGERNDEPGKTEN